MIIANDWAMLTNISEEKNLRMSQNQSNTMELRV